MRMTGAMMTSDTMRARAPDFKRADSCIAIDLDAIASNWRALAAMAGPDVESAAVVKANGYGLGAEIVGPTIARAGCRTFFVMSLGEAVQLRAALNAAEHPKARIFALGGCHHGQEGDFAKHAVTPVINSIEQLERLDGFAGGRDAVIEAALHIDTGMTRLGLDGEQSAWLAKRRGQDSTAFSRVNIILLMSHLSSSEVPGDPANATQLAAFRALRKDVGAPRSSLANSGGVFLGKDYHFELTRPGIAIYGMHPAGSPGKSDGDRNKDRDRGNDGQEHSLMPAVSWHARILQCRRARRGDTVGYNAAHELGRDSRIATLGVGYADGYRRALGGKAKAIFAGRPAPVVGRVSMDSITVDVTDIPERVLESAGHATVLGEEYGLGDMARDAGTIGYEVLTCLGRRPGRQYLSDGGLA